METMRAVAITGERACALVERPKPRPWGWYAVVRILVAPMCTEYKAYKNGWVGDWLGHEAAGVVEEVAGPCRVKPGERVLVLPQNPCGGCELCLSGEYVLCQDEPNVLELTGNSYGTSTYSQFLVKADWQLPRIPDELSIEEGSMACCALGPAFGAMRLTGLGPHQTVLITGLGPVGLGAVVCAKDVGARVIAVDGAPFRQNLARELGADLVLDHADPDLLRRVREATRDGRGVDQAIECAGVPEAHRLCVDAVRRRGVIGLVGEGGAFELKASDDCLRKQLTILGSWYYKRQDVEPLFRLIARNRSKIRTMITHRFPMSRVQEAFELQLRAETGKVLLDPWA